MEFVLDVLQEKKLVLENKLEKFIKVFPGFEEIQQQQIKDLEYAIKLIELEIKNKNN
jgi:hypothetical protein